MLAQLTIPKETTREAAIDHQQLYAIGLKHVQRLAGRIWTDYNVHDPGVTTLELLCYALTDLSYRASFAIKDLLATESGNAENMKAQFFTARRILPNRPLTLLDYRKLLIDLKGVKNAWLLPAAVTYYADTVKQKLLAADPNQPGTVEVALRGLYDVIVDYTDEISTEAAKKNVMKAVKQRLHANRDLCEDFVDFADIEAQGFILCSELELFPDADVAKVKAEVQFQVQEYLAPQVRNYTLSEMLERKKKDGTPYGVDDIFDGPSLDCGFIDDDELAQTDLRTQIRLSDIISIIMDIQGVKAVREIVINPEGTTVPLEDKWVVPVAARKKALLRRDLSRLVFYKRNMPVVPNAAKVEEYHSQLTASATAKAETSLSEDFDIPLGRYRDPGSYHSFQNHFPVIYGLSEVGLGSTAKDERKALAYQLKGYLLFLDQIMANYCAQLSHVKDLFSIDPKMQRTYFYQIVDSFREHERIYGIDDIVATLQDNVENKEDLIDRRNRFLDHLIARFAERFNDFANIMYSTFGSNPIDMVQYKCDFLRSYPEISSERALAYNYQLTSDEDLWNSGNVSGLERRLAKLLGIRNATRRNLADIAYDIYAEIDETPDDEFRFRIRNRDTGGILLSSSTNYASPELAKAEMQRAIHFALLPSGYERKITSDGKHYFNIIDDTGEVIARRIQYFDTEALMEQAIDEVMGHMQAHYSEEGMYLIENILLRPEQGSDPFLPICVDPNCVDCPEKDPYSYRIHIILPAENGRFSNMDFRRFAEGVIREETPAHILPKICWISKEDMAVLERHYRDWIYLKSGRETADRHEKLTKFIETLFSVKNIYPTQKLHPCDSGEDQPKFILGDTALGTQEP